MSRFGGYPNPDLCGKHGKHKSLGRTWIEKVIGVNKLHCNICSYNRSCKVK